ncbi:MAG: hypothetical protein ACTHXA_10785 [Gulosibacter sp.]|uniref:hypothetical protein n=1 Tax=Gulosibacter sp. TaxID=2817531 RepID=UPI003F937548
MFERRAETKRLRALQDLERRQHELLPGYKIWGYKNIFAKGFLITRGAAGYSPREEWDYLEFGQWRVCLDSVLEHQIALSTTTAQDGEQTGVLILGQVFDDRGPARRGEIASRLLKTITKAGAGREVSRRAADDAITWLSGRFIVFVMRGDVLDVYGDPMASRSCFWHDIGSGIALASHTAILSELAGGLSSERMRWVLRHPDYKSPAGKWLPGLITPHDDVGQVFANSRLTIQGRDVSYERFFPREDRRELSVEEAAAVFRRELQQQVRNWIAVAPQTVLALTAGSDSKAILRAGISDLQDAKAVALTYHPFHVSSKSTYEDLVTANRLAAAARLPQIVLDVGQMKPTSAMADLYRRTFPTWQRYANLANALYLGAPAKAATIFGVGGGIITGMFTDKSAPEPTPAVLAKKFAYSKFAENAEILQEFEKWQVVTQFSTEALAGHDFYDFFHWEHRMSKWGAAGYSEYDLATTPAPVLNSRRLLLTALAVPMRDRESKSLYTALQPL